MDRREKLKKWKSLMHSLLLYQGKVMFQGKFEKIVSQVYKRKNMIEKI